MPFTSDKTRQGAAGVSTGFEIPYSCRFEADSAAVLTRTPAGVSNRKTWTFSAWVKRGDLGIYSGIFGTDEAGGAAGGGGERKVSLNFDTDDTFRVTSDDTPAFKMITTALYRDTSAWYHIVLALDTTQGVEANRFKLYFNGTQVTSFSTSNYPAEDLEPSVNYTIEHRVGKAYTGEEHDGYLAEVHFIDGTALTPTSFGETGDYGEWKAKKVAGLTYGTNGFYIDFADAADLGDDESGEGNDFTEVNLAATDQMLDTPTNNFCTMNPLKVDTTLSPVTAFSEGNLKIVQEDGYYGASSTMGFSSGKWYAEFLILTSPSNHASVGIAPTQDPASDYWNNPQSGRDAYVYYGTTGNAPQEADSYGGAAIVAGDRVGIAVDMDNSKIWFSKNGTWQNSGDPAAGTNFATDSIAANTYEFILGDTGNAFDCDWIANFGQDSSFAGEETAQGNQDGNGIGDFYYTPPSGFLALCTSNLPAVAVTPSEHFNTKIWTGTTADQAITGVGFQPDFVWIKKRASGAMNHYLNDAVRGQGKTLYTDGDYAEYDYGATMLESFDSDGYTLDGAGAYVNANAETYVGWNWKAATTASGTTTGSGTGKAYSARYNTDAGFSIIGYLGNGTADHTIPHHLGKKPQFLVVKKRSGTGSWCVYNEKSTATKHILLNTTAGDTATHQFWSEEEPTSSVFTVWSNAENNENDESYIAYCWTSIDGFSKFGSYAGNGSTDGPFLYTGFRPAFVMVKRIDSATAWVIWDNKRDGYNLTTHGLWANGNDAEMLGFDVDFLSNGFKLRDTEATLNADGGTWIYLAFAETPFKYSNAR